MLKPEPELAMVPFWDALNHVTGAVNSVAVTVLR
ncbi:hypothetical protein HaLaN_20555, partial [Haematococcus lacustris]